MSDPWWKVLQLELQFEKLALRFENTAHSDNWYLRLSDRAMARSYHLLDYG